MSTMLAAPPTPASAPPTGRGWIIAPAWDVLFFTLTPAFIIPAVLALQQVFTSQQIWLVVISFCSMGHHLPGFLRAYGDAELRRRFFWRLALAPPLVLASAWWFEHERLHGLRVLVLLWAVWHGLMQTYGFLRIYDLKRGIRDARGGRLDWAACLAIFAVGTVFSPARMYGLLDALWQAGGPLFDVGWVATLRIAAGLIAAVVLALYVAHTAVRARRGEPVSVNKLLLLASTAVIWWFTGTLSDTLIGVAMFEVYHAVQYLAIVWVFHRRSIDAWASLPGAVGKLCQARWLLAAVYLGLIAAFGAVRYFSTSIAEESLSQAFAALLVASTLMHYYFDGFIWKVREKGNQEQLAGSAAGAASPSRTPARPGWGATLAHAAKWSLFILPAAALYGAERHADPAAAGRRKLETSRALAAVASGLPSAQLQLANAALDAGDLAESRKAAERAVALDPQSAEAHGTLGNVQLQSGDPRAAIAAYRRAVELDPASAGHRWNLAGALSETGRYEDADVEYQAAWARTAPAEQAAWKDDLATFYLTWAASGIRAGAPSADVLKRLHKSHELALRPAVRRDVLRLGAGLLWSASEDGPLRQAAARNDWPAAVEVLKGVLGRSIDSAEACLMLGLALRENERMAESALQAALAARPDLAEAHLELGRILWTRSEVQRQFGLFDLGEEPLASRARRHLRRAAELGLQLPEDAREILASGND